MTDSELQDALEAKMLSLKVVLEKCFTAYYLHEVMQQIEDIWKVMSEQERREIDKKHNTRQR